jgi:hypothetical protein
VPATADDMLCIHLEEVEVAGASNERLYKVGFLVPDLARPFARPGAQLVILEGPKIVAKDSSRRLRCLVAVDGLVQGSSVAESGSHPTRLNRVARIGEAETRLTGDAWSYATFPRRASKCFTMSEYLDGDERRT